MSGQGHKNFNGEWLRKAAITYTIEGGDFHKLGYHFELDHNEELILVSSNGRKMYIGDGVTIGGVKITRHIGEVIQKDLDEHKT